jgi:hypothetical protein
MKRIKFIYVDHVGEINSIDGEITAFLVNGEMAHVTWFIVWQNSDGIEKHEYARVNSAHVEYVAYKKGKEE